MRAEQLRLPRARDVIASVGGFLRWWADELAGAFPRAAAALSGGLPRVELETSSAPVTVTDASSESVVSGNVWVRGLAATSQGGNVLLALSGSLDDLDAEQQSALRRVCEGRRVDLVLSAPDVYRTSFRLPRAAVTDEGLRYALQTEAPVKIEHLVFAWCIEQPQPDDLAADWLQVRVAMCRRSTLGKVRAALQQAGVTAHRIGASYGSDHPTGGAALDERGFVFASERLRGLESPIGRSLMVVLALLAFLIPPIVGALFVAHSAKAINAEIETIRAQHGSALPLAQRRASLASLDASLRAVRQEVPVAMLLNELAQRLGDNVWIQDARIDGRQLRLQVQPGPNVEPDAIVAGLAASPLITDLRLETLSAGGIGRTLELTATIKQNER
jgi:hypothetical protein